MPTCQRVLYTGRVQGVGFRATAQHLAAAYPVGGYVRNLPTGAVELVAEGEPEAVADFLAAVAHHMAGYIESTTVYDDRPAGSTTFTVRH